MIKLFFIVAGVMLAAAGYGAEIKRYFPKRQQDYFYPLGFAALLMLLQFAYYPAMFGHWSSDYEHIVSCLILLVGLCFSVRNYRFIKAELWRGSSVWIVLAFSVFLLVFYFTNLQLPYSDSQMYLNYMSQNINTSHINLFHLWTGEIGKEWDAIYLFQGYYHFGSFLSWLCQWWAKDSLANITVQTWGLGMLYSLVSSGFLVNFCYALTQHKGKRCLLLLLGLLYINFYYWRVAFSFYGNTFRTLFIAAHLYYLYYYFQEDNRHYRFLCMTLSFAGLATSSSYLFIAFAMDYALMVFLFKQKGEGAIAEMADFVLPLVIYALALFSRTHLLFALGASVFALAYYTLRKKKVLQTISRKMEGFLQCYTYRIFVFGAAFLLAAGGAVYYFLVNPHYEYNYAHYFQNHQLYDMIKDYFCLYSGKTQTLVNVFRYIGIFLLWRSHKKTPAIHFAKIYVGVILFVFLNPLSTVAIAKLFASNVYYRTFDALFNPFTELVIGFFCLEKFYDQRYGKALSILLVSYLLVYAHGFSFYSAYAGEYGEYVHEEILAKYKMNYADYEAASFFQKEISTHKKSQGQWRVISHVEGLRTFVPEVWQVFTLREYYYPQERINEEFYQQARNHYSYGKYPETDFSSACRYLQRFQIDYLLIETANNPDYDIEVSKCSAKIYENDRFHIYRFFPIFEPLSATSYNAYR